MVWAPIHRGLVVEEFVAATPEAFISPSINTQRLNDERGGMHISFDGDPGAVTGSIFLQGRLSPDAEFAQVFEGGVPVELDLSTTHAALFTASNNSIPMLPEIRLRGEAVTVTNTVTATISITE